MIKLILNIGSPLIGRLLTVDALTMQFQEFELQKSPHCRLCNKNEPFESLPDYTLSACQKREKEVTEISVAEFYELSQKKAKFFLLDVRESYEHAICNLGGYLIPLSQMTNRLNELDKTESYIIYCKTGERSRKAVKILQEAGFTSVKNLRGGILAWAKEIDKQMVTY